MQYLEQRLPSILRKCRREHGEGHAAMLRHKAMNGVLNFSHRDRNHVTRHLASAPRTGTSLSVTVQYLVRPNTNPVSQANCSTPVVNSGEPDGSSRARRAVISPIFGCFAQCGLW